MIKMGTGSFGNGKRYNSPVPLFLVGSLQIFSNESLINLKGLDNIASIGDSLLILFNNKLIDFDGLNNLTSIGNILCITKNESLTSVDGLNNLISIGNIQGVYGGMSVSDNIGTLVSLAGNALCINSNYSLTNLDGLSNLTTIEGDLHINSNSVLPTSTSEEFANRVTISGETFFRDEEYIPQGLNRF